jgi:transcriptional regulator with XRE-family HTH domain
MVDANPTARQRELSRRLRILRDEKGLTLEAVAEKLLCSATKISRIETSKRKASLRDVRDLCEVYGVTEPETTQLMSLARSAREEGWWARYDDLGVGPYLGLEQEAKAITYYSMTYVHGLLQTESYARSIIRAIYPQIAEQILKERVEARIQRQELLDKADRPRLRVLLDEAVLRRHVGGPKVMVEQLTKILDATAREKAIVLIVPFSSGAQAGSESNFTLFEFEDATNILHIEGLLSSISHDKLAVIERYREVLDHLRDAALSPRESQNLITEIKDELQTLINNVQTEGNT